MSIRSDEQNIICARNRTIKDLKTQLAEKDREIKEAMSMLENVLYWYGCPDDYKERIEKLMRLL